MRATAEVVGDIGCAMLKMMIGTTAAVDAYSL